MSSFSSSSSPSHSPSPFPPTAWTRLAVFALPLGVFALALWVYRQTLLPGVGIWDTAEFQAVPYLLGIMHATGYPFYTLLGKLVSYWPAGSIAWRMNWFSALCAAGASSALVIAARRLGAGWGPAIAAGLALAFGTAFWQTADRADPHTLQTLLEVLIFDQAIAWRRTRRFRSLGWLALLSGLALANHMKFTMLLPALAGLVLLGDIRLLRRPRELAALLGCLLPGLACFAYLPIRARMQPPLDYGRPTDWPHFRALVLGEKFQQDMGFLSSSGLETFLVQLYRVPGLYADWLTPAGALAFGLFAAAGLYKLFRTDRLLGLFFLAAALPPLYVACTWINGDIQRYYFTPTVLLLLLAASGAQGLIDLARKLAAPRLGQAVSLLLGVAIAAAPLTLIPRNWPACDRHAEQTGAQYAAHIYSRLKPNAVILTVWIGSTPLWYTHYVEQRRPDVTILDESDVTMDGYGSMENAVAAFAGRRPVYLSKPSYDVDAIKRRFATRSLGPVPYFGYDLVEVTPLQPSKR